MTHEAIHKLKCQANEIFCVFEKYKRGVCSFDRALEEAATLIQEHSDKRVIVGYVKSGTLADVLRGVVGTKKENSENPYIFDCQIHKSRMDEAERMYQSIK